MAETIRPARLMRAGVYTDKGLEITPADLEALCLCEAADIWLEHAKSPFDIGKAKNFRIQEGELWGDLHFSPGAWDLAKHSAINGVSISIVKDSNSPRLREVSLTTKPRVVGAAVFNEADEGPLLFNHMEVIVSDNTNTNTAPNESNFFAELGRRFMAGWRPPTEPEQAKPAAANFSAEDIGKMLTDAVDKAVKPLAEQLATVEANFSKQLSEKNREAASQKLASIPPALRPYLSSLLKADTVSVNFSAEDGKEEPISVSEAASKIIDVLAENGKVMFSEHVPNGEAAGKSDIQAHLESTGVKPEDAAAVAAKMGGKG